MSPVARRKPRFNHVAMSVAADSLDERGRADICAFYDEVFGWKELPTETIDRKRLILMAYEYDQFVFLIADEPHMTGPRMDHFGMGVGSEEELDEFLAKAKAYRERDERVDIVDKATEDYGALSVTSFYVGYLLPLMVEVQYFDFKQSQ